MRPILLSFLLPCAFPACKRTYAADEFIFFLMITKIWKRSECQFQAVWIYVSRRLWSGQEQCLEEFVSSVLISLPEHSAITCQVADLVTVSDWIRLFDYFQLFRWFAFCLFGNSKLVCSLILLPQLTGGDYPSRRSRVRILSPPADILT